MPGCPTSCPKVQKQLERKAAEKKKALETRLRPPDEDEEEKVPEDRIPDDEPTPDFYFEEELESEHGSQGRSKGPGESKITGSGKKSLKNSGHDLSRRSSKDQNWDRRKNRVEEEKFSKNRIPVEEPTPAGFDSGEKFVLDSDPDSQGEIKKGPGKSKSPSSEGRSSRNSGHNLSGRSSKDRNSDRKKNRDEEEKVRNDIILVEEPTPADFDSSEKFVLYSDPDSQGEIKKGPGEPRSPGSGGRSSMNSGHNLSEKSSKDRNANRRKNRDEEEKVRNDIIFVEKTTPANIHSGEKFVLESDPDSQEEIKKGPGESKSPGSEGRSLRNSGHNLSGRSSKDRNSEKRKNLNGEEKVQNDMILVEEPIPADFDSGEKLVLNSDPNFQGEIAKDPGESRSPGSGGRSLRNSGHSLSGRSSKDRNSDSRKNRDEEEKVRNDMILVEEPTSADLDSGEKFVLESDPDSQGEIKKDPGESKITGSGGRSSRNSGHNLSGRSSKDRNSEKRTNINEEEKVRNDMILVEEPTPADFYSGEKFELESDLDSQRRISKTYGESRSPVGGRRSSRNSGHNLSGRSSKNRNSDRRKNRGGSLGSESSDFGGSDGESRGPGNGKKHKDENYRLSGKSSGKSGRDNSRAGPSTSSAGEYFLDQDFDLAKNNPRSSECSLRRMKEEMLRRKREAKQKEVDEYLLNKGMNYFEDLCNCSARCLAQQLWNDPFVRKIFVSAALFAVGIKLCWEMDAWYIPAQ